VSSIFTGAVEAAIRGETVCVWPGAWLDLRSSPLALWTGVGSLDASAFGGPLFLGAGKLGGVSDEMEIGSTAPTQQVVLTLSGLDPSLLTVLENQETEVSGRRCCIYFLTFAGAPEWRLVACAKRRTLVMDRMALTVAPSDGGNHAVAIELTAEPILAAKSRAPSAYLTDADQRRRHPGDRSCERIQRLVQKQSLIFTGQ
jgi:hypothetical protein